MTKKIYEKLAIMFYPQNIDCIMEKNLYIESPEYTNLLGLSNYFKNNNNIDLLLSSLKKQNLEFSDVSLLDWQDRCFTLEKNIQKNNKNFKVIIYLSYIIPAYLIEFFENDIDIVTKEWLTFPKRNIDLFNSEYLDIKNKICQIIENEFNYYEFPNNFINEKILNLSFQDIRFNQFTMYNAFFKNDFI